MNYHSPIPKINSIRNTPATFLIDGVHHPAYLKKPLLPDMILLADAHGFDIVGRVRDKDHLVLHCRTCKTDNIKRWSVVRDDRPVCHACIRARRDAAADAHGAAPFDRVKGDRHVGRLKLACGHVVERQFYSIERSVKKGHTIACPECREARYATEADQFGWTLVGPPSSGKRSYYRSYRHICGHLQDISIGNMVWGDCACARCGSRWNARPSHIYLFGIDLPSMPVVKLGYSARPAKRLRHQLGIHADVQTRVLRVIQMPSGHAAVQAEKACHATLLAEHPHLVVSKTTFGDAINTQGEIYRIAAAPLIYKLMDAIALHHPQDQSPAATVKTIPFTAQT